MDIPDFLATALRTDVTVRRLEPSLYSVFPPEHSGAPYDNKAEAYDRMVSSDRYLRFAWGAQRSTILSFMQEAFSSSHGTIVDLAAGTSVDAYRIYTETVRPTIVVDLSVQMLRRGMSRVTAATGAIPDNIVFLQADALCLPIGDKALSTIICHGGFHLFPALDRIVAEWRRVLVPDGGLYVTSLVKERRLGNVYLQLLARAGEVSEPMSAEQVRRIVGAGMGCATELAVEGNFAYVRI